MVNSWVTAYAGSVSTVHKSQVSRHSATARSGSNRNLRFVRSLFFVLAFLILFTGFSFMRSFASSTDVSAAGSEELVISVDSGDTLWGLAATYKKDSLDTREAVHTLMKRNGLSSSSLEMGQTLIIPSRILP